MTLISNQVLARPSQGPVKIIDIKKFRKITYKGLTFFTLKSAGNLNSVLVRKNQDLLNIMSSQPSNIFEYNMLRGKQKFEVVCINFSDKRFYRI